MVAAAFSCTFQNNIKLHGQIIVVKFAAVFYP